jgi:putative transposase
MRSYYGGGMNVYEIAPGFRRLSRLTALSKEARLRLKWFDYYYAHGENGRLTCRHFGIAPQTFYRWKKRFSPKDLSSLEERTRRPRHVRQPEYQPELVEAVRSLREQYPRWGKDKLVVLLREAGFLTSTSTVGRILARLKKRGLLHEPPCNGISARKRQRKRPYAVRKPKEYVARAPGDIVQLDTLDVRPLPGVVLKHFTARDVVSRWDVLEAHTTATARTASAFIDVMLQRMPFPVKAIQVDGGPEFTNLFEAECQKRGIRLFVLPPRSPKLNGHVERAQRTHTEEFYEVTDCNFDLPELNKALRKWEHVYDTVRPHQALGYLTPLQFLQQYHHNRKEVMCHQ